MFLASLSCCVITVTQWCKVSAFLVAMKYIEPISHLHLFVLSLQHQNILINSQRKFKTSLNWIKGNSTRKNPHGNHCLVNLSVTWLFWVTYTESRGETLPGIDIKVMHDILNFGSNLFMVMIKSSSRHRSTKSLSWRVGWSVPSIAHQLRKL